MGGDKNERHILRITISQTGGPQREKRALIAVGHSILKAVWHILHDNVSYSELGADYLTEKVAERRKAYLQSELKALGFDVTLTRLEALPQTA